MDPHTAAKHQLLDGYLAAWFPIIAQRYPSFTYAEGFAGPNEYEGGEYGSPSIALLQASRDDVLAKGRTMRLVFIEKHGGRFAHLERTIEAGWPAVERSAQMQITCVNGACEVDLLPALERVGAWGAPVFANLDGWGADADHSVVRRIGSNKSPEVLVTMAPSFFMRFATVEDTDAGDRFFGDRSWREVANEATPADKRRFLIDRYRAALRAAGFPRALHFEMRDEGGHELYLFFGTANDLGIEKMKDSMWKIDASLGQQFRDPRDPDQLAFSLDAVDLAPLKRELVSHLSERGGASVDELKGHALLETIYRRPHVTAALTELRDGGEVSSEPRRITGKSTIRLVADG